MDVHTSGPWSGIPWANPRDERELVSEAEGRYIALADLWLIAVAPDLLEALQNIVMNARLIPDPAMQGYTETYSVSLDDIDAARAAIARAKGEA